MLKRIYQRWRYTQHSQLTVIRDDGGDRRVVYETSAWIEAPNWSPDGQWLVFNGAGKLFRVRVDGTEQPQHINTHPIQNISNDHLISPDGNTVYFTAGGRIYSVPFEGGHPTLVSHSDAADPLSLYLHGISPDGKCLSCVGINSQEGGMNIAIYLLSAIQGPAKRITFFSHVADGPEYAPDGQWIYFNAELNARRTGHSQLYRMHIDGSGAEQLTFDDHVNWFPHVAPDGTKLVFLSYPKNTQGHPANCSVALRCLKFSTGQITDLVSLYGGQGTINTNSWAPDSSRLAYVAYPLKPR